MKLRQAGGGKKSGRYRKHDTARLRCLTRVVYPGLRMGKLPSVTGREYVVRAAGPARDHRTVEETHGRLVEHVRTRPALQYCVIRDDGRGAGGLLVWASEHVRITTAPPRGPPAGRPHVRITS